MSRHATAPTPEVVIEVRGEVPPGAALYARSKIRALTAHVRDPILFARVKLSTAGDPAVSRPAIAQASLDVNGRMVRVHVAAKTMREAVDALQDRLRERLERMSRDWEDRRGRVTRSDRPEWRHDSESARRPHYYPRPVEEREIVRHKSFNFAVQAADEAAFEMDALDYDFYLFVDVETGLDAVVYRAGPTGYRLARTRVVAETPEPYAVPLTVSAQPAPRLRVAAAVRRLEMTGWPFVFFADVDTGRGEVLYHRYDGHYGLITPGHLSHAHWRS